MDGRWAEMDEEEMVWEREKSWVWVGDGRRCNCHGLVRVSNGSRYGRKVRLPVLVLKRGAEGMVSRAISEADEGKYLKS